RLDALRFHEQQSVIDVVDLVVTRRRMNERRLICVLGVVRDIRWAISKLKISVQPRRQLHEIRRRIAIELSREEVIGGGTEPREEDGKRRGAEADQSRLESQRHGGAAVSMYPTPRTV